MSLETSTAGELRAGVHPALKKARVASGDVELNRHQVLHLAAISTEALIDISTTPLCPHRTRVTVGSAPSATEGRDAHAFIARLQRAGDCSAPCAACAAIVGPPACEACSGSGVDEGGDDVCSQCGGCGEGL